MIYLLYIFKDMFLLQWVTDEFQAGNMASETSKKFRGLRTRKYKETECSVELSVVSFNCYF